MREINNNREIGKIPQKEVKFGEAEKAISQEIVAENKEIKDLSSPNEISGRSLVSKADNLKEDVAFGAEHPEAIERSDKLFNLALAKLEAEGNPNAYEIASSIATSEDAKAILSR